MKNCLTLIIVFLALAYAFDTDEKRPPQNCDDLCFCPCQVPGDTERIINPNQDCLARIDCIADTLECSAEVMACEEQKPKELCFCPCRIPGCGPDVLYYPGQKCLERIRCAYGQSECSAEYLGFSS